MNDANWDQLVLAFFSSPNTVWPGMATDHPAADRIMTFLGALDARGECPLVLPRRDVQGQPSTMYVVCWDRSHAGRMRPLLWAAVADYLSPFDGRVASLKADDPLEAAILAMVGSGTTFLLRPEPQTEGRLIAALQRLVLSLRGRPRRNPVLSRPVGRMLREFNLALAAGAADQSAAILQEIERAGGISHENVAFLQIQRLGHLGRDRELLTHGSLPTITHTEPPQAVCEAILAAWGRQNLRTGGVIDPDGAAERLSTDPIDVAMLVGERITATSNADALSVGALVALARGDANLGAALQANDGLPTELRLRLAKSLPATTRAAGVSVEHNASSPATVEDESESAVGAERDAPISSWFDWLNRLEGGGVSPPVTNLVQGWEPAWRVDQELGPAIDSLPDLATDALLSGVAAFLDTDDRGHPAPQTARAFMRRYLIEERFGPADLSALASLVATFLRSAPGRDAYISLLDDLSTFAPQWSSVASATQALDLADTVACGPRAVPEVLAGFIAAVLAPLNGQRQRLTGSLRSLAAMITKDVGLDWEWGVAEPNETASAVLPDGLSVLIYSLDAGTLARVAASLNEQYPTLTVHRSSDKVGTPVLRQHSRRADLIAIATGRAAHAATGFITSNAGGRICYPDGCGAASMLRVIERCLDDLRSD